MNLTRVYFYSLSRSYPKLCRPVFNYYQPIRSQHNKIQEVTDVQSNLSSHDYHQDIQYQNHYQVLNIPKSAKKQDIERAYLDLVKEHGDILGRINPRMQSILEAYEHLSDSERRVKYDAVTDSTGARCAESPQEAEGDDEALVAQWTVKIFKLLFCVVFIPKILYIAYQELRY